MSGDGRGIVARVSVVMSVYNAERYLAQAVRSILQQDLEDFEFVVVDDGSTDGSLGILRSFSDGRLVVLEQENQGLPKALNRGVRQARAPLIARMDADDVSMPNRLRLQLEFLEQNSDHVAVGSNARVIDEDGRYVYATDKPLDDRSLRARCLQTPLEPPLIHPASMFRRAAFTAAGGYSEQVIGVEDTVLFNRMMRSGKFANLAEPLIQYRIVPTSITRRERASAEFSRIVQKAIESNCISAAEARYLAERTGNRSAQSRVVGYHSFLAKKLLWNSHRPVEARMHLRSALRLRPTWEATLLYGASFLPESLVRRAYRMGKRWV
ncbi:MAG: glycosyltransferase [Pirellulaceae bacterium]